jgi:hypothetical protein
MKIGTLDDGETIEESCLLVYNNVQSAESEQRFRKNISPSSSGSKIIPARN